MQIAFYMPFKPLGHSSPSGDLIIGTELFDFLKRHGHDIRLVSRLRCRWVYWKPWIWPALAAETARIWHQSSRWHPDVWLTYHAYYKAPDILGPMSSRLLNIPYVIFQGVYSTKQRRRPKAVPGFYLNRFLLTSASAVLTNKKRDLYNLRRLIPENRLHYVKPGIRPEAFGLDSDNRTGLREKWGATSLPVIITAAMFRPGVKTDGVLRVIRACGVLQKAGLDFRLVIVGDGSEKKVVRKEAQRVLAGRFLMTGQVPRNQLYRYYNAADLFVFPGIHEGLGMVYLEAQACGLPVVAFRDWGAAETVVDGETGLLSPAKAPNAFAKNIRSLIEDKNLRRSMGTAARNHVLTRHDMNRNYLEVDRLLRDAAETHGRKRN